MPFNASGIFQRLFRWQDDRDDGIKILAERMDQETDGIADGINTMVRGEIGFKGPVIGVFGTASAPAFSFQDDRKTGMYRSSAGALSFSAVGTHVLKLTPDRIEALKDFKKGTFEIDGNFLSFHDGESWISYEEGGHNFGLRSGNKQSGPNDIHTSDGHGAVQVVLNHQASDPEFKVRIGNSGALGETVDWSKDFVAKASGALTWGGQKIWHEGNSGEGSGIDADTLDGKHASYFLPFASYTPEDILAKLKTVAGAGSQLDADLLDGLEGSAYRNADNLKAGTVPVDRLSGTYEISISGSAKDLGGKDSAYFRNAGNLNAGIVPPDRMKGTYSISIFGSASSLGGTPAADIITNLGTTYRVWDNSGVDTPTNFGSAGVKFELKKDTTDGLTSGGSYHGVMSFQPSGEWSGGATHQIGFTNDGGLYNRSASIGGSWGSWNRLVNTNDLQNQTYGDVGSYVWAITNTKEIILPGRNYAGSRLKVSGFNFDTYSNLLPKQGQDYPDIRGEILSGTWRAMSSATRYENYDHQDYVCSGLFVRIA